MNDKNNKDIEMLQNHLMMVKEAKNILIDKNHDLTKTLKSKLKKIKKKGGKKIMSNNWENCKTKTIPFSGAITLVVSLIIYAMFYKDMITDEIFLFRISLTNVYIVLALLSTNSKEFLKKTVEQVWEINKTNEISAIERKSIILNFLTIAVYKWNKFWRMFQEIVLSEKPIQEKMRRTKDLFRQIIKGEINLFQALWIFAYLSYSIIISSNFFQIATPIDFLVNIAFLLIILFESGSIIGIGAFIFEIFKTLIPVDEKYIQNQLTNLEHVIMNGSKTYYFLDFKK